MPGHANSDITQDVNDILSDNAVADLRCHDHHPRERNGRGRLDGPAGPINIRQGVRAFQPGCLDASFFFTNASVESETLVMMRQG